MNNDLKTHTQTRVGPWKWIAALLQGIYACFDREYLNEIQKGSG